VSPAILRRGLVRGVVCPTSYGFACGYRLRVEPVPGVSVTLERSNGAYLVCRVDRRGASAKWTFNRTAPECPNTIRARLAEFRRLCAEVVS